MVTVTEQAVVVPLAEVAVLSAVVPVVTAAGVAEGMGLEGVAAARATMVGKAETRAAVGVDEVVCGVAGMAVVVAAAPVVAVCLADKRSTESGESALKGQG